MRVCVRACVALFVIYFVGVGWGGVGVGLLRRKGERKKIIYFNGFCFGLSSWA